MVPLSQFVGIPYSDLVSSPGAQDGCYGLVLRVYRECLGIELVPASGARSDEGVRKAERDLLVAAEALEFTTVARASGRGGLVWSERPKILDILYSKSLGQPHVGLVASEDGLTMLHAYLPVGVCASSDPVSSSHIIRLDRPAWSRALVAAYRHPSLA